MKVKSFLIEQISDRFFVNCRALNETSAGETVKWLNGVASCVVKPAMVSFGGIAAGRDLHSRKGGNYSRNGI